jgi:uncharacterized protein YfaS (alpha-2-macroglobulin family)
VEEYQLAGITYGSSTRDRALLVEALISTGSHDQALPIVKRLADELASGTWYSTQTTAFALMALSRFAAHYEDKELYFAYHAGGDEKKTIRQNKPVFQHHIEEGKPGMVSVENLADAPLYVRLIRRGRPLEPLNKSEQSNLSLQVAYHDMEGNAINPERIKQGTDFVMTVTIGNPATYSQTLEEVALQCIFPSGWEIVNRRLDLLANRWKDSPSDYQDIRDDRVYTFFDMHGRTNMTYNIALNATYAGKYVMPAVYCEAMYDNAVKATVPGKWVEVTSDQLKIAKAGISGNE